MIGRRRLGRSLTSALADSYTIVNLDRAPAPRSPSGVEFERFDVTSDAGVVDALGGAGFSSRFGTERTPSRARYAYCRAAIGARHIRLPTNNRRIAAPSTELTPASGSPEQSQWTILCFGRSMTRHDRAARFACEPPWDSPTLVTTVVCCAPDSAVAALSVTSAPNKTRTVAALVANGETRWIDMTRLTESAHWAAGRHRVRPGDCNQTSCATCEGDRSEDI